MNHFVLVKKNKNKTDIISMLTYKKIFATFSKYEKWSKLHDNRIIFVVKYVNEILIENSVQEIVNLNN